MESIKEYTFYARTCSYKKIILSIISLILLCIISLILFFFTGGESLPITLLLIASILSILFFNILSSRYIKIITDEDSISIYYWKQLKYKAHINQLIEVREVDIEKNFTQSELHFVFDDRTFIFVIWEWTCYNSNFQTKMLRDLVSRYQLKKELYKRGLNHTYKYKNIDHRIH